MPKGISGSGGVDTSALDGLIAKLEEAYEVQNKINQIKITPKADDSELRKINDELSNLRKRVEEQSKTPLELFNTKRIQDTINKAQIKLDGFYEKIKSKGKNLTPIQTKDFLENFELLQKYSDHFGTDLTSKYKSIYDEMMQYAQKNYGYLGEQAVKYTDTFQSEFNKMLTEAKVNAKELLNYDLFDANNQATDKLYQEQRNALLEQKEAIKENLEATNNAERQKQERYRETRDRMVNDIKSAFDEIRNTAGDNEYLHIDEQSWGLLQQKFYDLTQLMSQMGFEVKDIEKSFGDLSNKVYVPTDKINAVRDAMAQSSAEAQEMANDVNKISGSLSNIDDSKIKKLQEEIESWQQSYYQLYNRVHEMNAEMERMYSEGEFENLAARTWEYESALEKANQQLEELRRKYELLKDENEILIDENRDLQSTRDNVTSNISKVTKETEQASQETKAYENVSKEAFDSGNLSGYVNILAEIKKILQDISSALGAVDKSNSFSNVITNVDTLLSKLDEMYQKIGTGVYNIQVNQGVDKSAQQNMAETSDYIKSTRARYANAYQKVVSKAGGEEKLFAYINNATNINGGIDALYRSFATINVANIESAETQIYRLMDFFKILRQAISSGDFGLDLSGMKLPSSNDSYVRSQIREKSGIGKNKEDLIELEDEKINLNEITDKLTEIRDLLSEISQKDLFGDNLTILSSRLDEIVQKFETLVADVKVINETPIQTTDKGVESKLAETTTKKDSSKSNIQTDKEIQQATDAIKAEGKAAEEAATKKEKFAQANEKVAQSGKTTATSTTAATNAVKAEGDAAEKAANQFNTASDAVEGYIRKQRGKADSGNYNYTQAINKVVDKQVTKTTDSEGNVATIETLLVNYDKLSKELVKTDTEIFNLQQQIKNTTQGNTQGLQNNLDILKDQRKTYEKLLDLMIQEDKYAITDTQKTVLDGQRAKNLEWLQNIQDTKDSINQLKQNSQTVSLGLKVEVKSRELEDYVAKLKELNVFTPKVEQETLNLSRSLSQVTSGKGLADWTNEFKILKSDMSSVVSGSQDNIKTIANQQVSAYKNIWSIRKQIAKLDTTADANLISELQAQEQEQKNIYITKTQELKAINQQVAREQVLNNIVNIRRQAEDEIKNIKAKQSDAEVINNYNTIIAKYREIKQLNRDIQSLITAGVSSNELVITDRQDKINTLKTEISLIDQTKFSTEQLTEINNAYAESEQVVADAEEKRKAKGAQEQQQIDKTRNSLLQQASALTTNGKLMRKYGDDVNSYIKELQNTSTTKERLEEIKIALMNIKTEANLAGQSGKTFMQILKSRFTSLGAYISTFTSFYRIISYVRQAFTTLTDLDTQLVDLRKTTSMTTNELNEFYSASSDVAKQLGVTTSEIISQAAAWSRFNKIDPLYGNI